MCPRASANMLQVGFILVRALPREKKAKENKKNACARARENAGARPVREGREDTEGRDMGKEKRQQ